MNIEDLIEILDKIQKMDKAEILRLADEIKEIAKDDKIKSTNLLFLMAQISCVKLVEEISSTAFAAACELMEKKNAS